jgi:hypothetical protein
VIVHISIGNSDNKLTQSLWAGYVAEVDCWVVEYALTIHGAYFSLPTVPWQNACWAFEIDADKTGFLKKKLKGLAKTYDQEAIAWNETPETEMIRP